MAAARDAFEANDKARRGELDVAGVVAALRVLGRERSSDDVKVCLP